MPAVPPIEPVPPDTGRPFWSVMIPTYRTDPALLRAAIDSVLDAGLPADEVQIEVANDDARDDEISRLVRKYGGAVRLHDNPNRLGAPANFTECVRRATGQWVHILHADDAVTPDFYDTYRGVIDRIGGCVMVSGQTICVNERGEWFGTSPAMPATDGVLDDATVAIASRHPCNFAATVVARAAYEQVGGFDNRLAHANDWEMWARVSSVGQVGWVDVPHAYFRRHSGSDSTRLQQSSAYITDCLAAIDTFLGLFADDQQRRQVRAGARMVVSEYALDVATGHLAAHRRRAAIRDAVWGIRVRPCLSTIGRGGDTIARACAARIRRAC